MSTAAKMVKLSIEETSGVDHPAHMQEGWIVMKSTGDEIREVFDSLTDTTEEVVKMEDMVPKADLDDATAKIADYETRISELEAEIEVAKAAAETEIVETVEEIDETEALLKAAPEAVIKMVRDAEARAEAAEAVLKAEREAAALAETVEFVKAWGNLPLNADEFAPALLALRALDEGVAKQVEDALTVANDRAENADLFTEIGKSATPVDGGDAYQRLASIAKSRVETGKNDTFEQALADAASENIDIYNDYLSEKGA